MPYSEIACCLLSLYLMLFRLAIMAGSIRNFSCAVAGFPASPVSEVCDAFVEFPQ
jgi:hypothetical protein